MKRQAELASRNHAKNPHAAMGWTMNAAMGGEAIMPQEELFFRIQRLRQYAVNKKLDMTDAFEEVRAPVPAL
jgi:hypothetical protein